MKDSNFAELVTVASFPAEVHRMLEEGNNHFLATFRDYVVDIVDKCQKEVLAAKVPLASYGRVHTALNDVKSQLEGSAQDLLVEEFAQLRTGALESLKAQRDEIEASNEARFQSTVDPIQAAADARVAEAEAKQAAATAEAERLQAAYSEPEDLIHRLQEELAAATARAAQLEARVKAYEEDWAAAYPQALAASTLVPPPLPPDTPYLVRSLDLKGMTVDHFFKQLDPGGTGQVSRADVRKAMLALELLPAAGTAEDTALFQELDAKAGTHKISVQELSEILHQWEGPPPRKLTKGQAKAHKEKPPAEGALERALDRNYAAEAHGSRLRYLVGLYEKALKESSHKHADELRVASTKAKEEGSSAAEAEAMRARDWESQRKEEQSKHAEQVREVMAQLEEEKLAHQQDVSSVRESGEKAKAEAVRSERDKADELKARLDEKAAECERLSRELSATTSELEATKQAKDERSFMIKQSKEEQAAEQEAFEVKLRQANLALMKAEAAQPTQGGYYCAAARIEASRPARSVSPSGTSPESSPDRSLFDKAHRLAFERAQRLREASGSPTRSTPPSVEVTIPLRTPISSDESRAISSQRRTSSGKQSSKGKSRRKSS